MNTAFIAYQTSKGSRRVEAVEAAKEKHREECARRRALAMNGKGPRNDFARNGKTS